MAYGSELYEEGTLREHIHCPHCGFVNEDSWEYADDQRWYHCPRCGRDSDLEVQTTRLYATTKAEE